MGLMTSPSAGPITQTTTTLQNAAVALGNGTALTINTGDYDVYVETIGASVPNAIVSYEWSNDGGSTYVAAAVEDTLSATGLATRILTTTVSTTKARLMWRSPPGATNFRARISTFVAGTITVTAIVRSRT